MLVYFMSVTIRLMIIFVFTLAEYRKYLDEDSEDYEDSKSKFLLFLELNVNVRYL